MLSSTWFQQFFLTHSHGIFYVALHTHKGHLTFTELLIHIFSEIFRFFLNFSIHFLFCFGDGVLCRRLNFFLEKMFSQSKIYQRHAMRLNLVSNWLFRSWFWMWLLAVIYRRKFFHKIAIRGTIYNLTRNFLTLLHLKRSRFKLGAQHFIHSLLHCQISLRHRLRGLLRFLKSWQSKIFLKIEIIWSCVWWRRSLIRWASILLLGIECLWTGRSIHIIF